MQYHLECPQEFQSIEKKLLIEIERSKKEIHSKLAPPFTSIIETRIALLKEIIGLIEDNLNITGEELAVLVDSRLETEEKALDSSNNVFDTDRIFTNIRILEWITYLIIEKNGRHLLRLLNRRLK